MHLHQMHVLVDLDEAALALERLIDLVLDGHEVTILDGERPRARLQKLGQSEGLADLVEDQP